MTLKCATYLAKYIYLWSCRCCIQLWQKYDPSFIMYSTSTMGMPCPRRQDSRNTALFILAIHPVPQFTSCRHLCRRHGYWARRFKLSYLWLTFSAWIEFWLFPSIPPGRFLPCPVEIIIH